MSKGCSAKSPPRSKPVGFRKYVGPNRKQSRVQFGPEVILNHNTKTCCSSARLTIMTVWPTVVNDVDNDPHVQYMVFSVKLFLTGLLVHLLCYQRRYTEADCASICMRTYCANRKLVTNADLI